MMMRLRQIIIFNKAKIDQGEQKKHVKTLGDEGGVSVLTFHEILRKMYISIPNKDQIWKQVCQNISADSFNPRPQASFCLAQGEPESRCGRRLTSPMLSDTIF